MILRFLICGSCYAQIHAFSTHFFQIFLYDIFLLAKLFSHISCKNPLKPINIYHVLHLPKYFSLPTWWKNITEFPAMGKSQNYWGEGMEVKYWGDVSPRNLQPWIYMYSTSTSYRRCGLKRVPRSLKRVPRSLKRVPRSLKALPRSDLDQLVQHFYQLMLAAGTIFMWLVISALLC